MYKLIGSAQTRAFRVVWMLEELGLVYQHINASPQSEEVLALNPSGKIPALIVEGEAIIDSSAIVQYLADKHKKFTYSPGTMERAQQDSFLHFANDEMDGTCWTAAKHSFALPEEFRLDGVIHGCKHDWKNAMATLETRLGDKQYVMGDQFTVPDIIIGHVAGWAKFAGFEWPTGKVSDYFGRLRTRPAFIKAIEIRKSS